MRRLSCTIAFIALTLAGCTRGGGPDQDGALVYSEIAAGALHSCGIRADDQTIACWGDDNLTNNIPSGTFTTLSSSAGAQHACALGTDGEIACWGANHHGQSDAPAGTFSFVTVGASHSCALDEAGQATCWGRDGASVSSPPPGSFSHLEAGVETTCGVDEVGALTCWGASGIDEAVDYAVSDISIGHQNWCVLDGDGMPFCWPLNFNGVTPEGPFTTLSANVNHGSPYACGIRPDGSLACWGDVPDEPPSGVFIEISAGMQHACGLRESGHAVCWGSDNLGKASAL